MTPPCDVLQKGVKGSREPGVRDLGSEGSEIAREDLAAVAPPIAVQDIGVRIPAVVAPVDADRAEHAGVVPNVEDVGVTIGQQRAVFAVRLALHEPPDLAERRLDFFFSAEVSDDLVVVRALRERERHEVAGRDILLHLAGEPAREVGAVVRHHLHAGSLGEERLIRLERTRFRRLRRNHRAEHLVGALRSGLLGTVTDGRDTECCRVLRVLDHPLSIDGGK